MKTILSKASPEVIPRPPVFKSFFAGGFECSTFKRRNGRRMDFIAATQHDRFAHLDYARLQKQGMRVAREGVRWHVVEATPGRYDFSSLLPIVRAARATGTQVIWDLCHFGWPDHLDIFKSDFVQSLVRYGAAFAEFLANEMNGPGFFVPVNEISFFSWAAGDEGSMFPFVTGRGFELKTHLVRASIEAIRAIWAIQPEARFIQIDPIINVVASPRRPEEQPAAEAYRISQYQSWDMLAGRMWPELGGKERYLDVIGVNFYPHNQWFYNLKGNRRISRFTPVRQTSAFYRPFRQMLAEVYQRYHRPILIAETGTEDEARPHWLRYVCQEVDAAIEQGIPIQGICLYPILNHPGWIDDRHCHNGLWDYSNEKGERQIFEPLAAEIRRWQKHFESGTNRSSLTHDSEPPGDRRKTLRRV